MLILLELLAELVMIVIRFIVEAFVEQLILKSIVYIFKKIAQIPKFFLH